MAEEYGHVKPSELKKAAKGHHVGFKKLEAELTAKGNVTNPAAVAAAIGREKYGATGMAALAAAGRAKAAAKRKAAGK
ncbi:hypothetical protein [Mycobacterium heckeshornense]|uniref:hypothetical protein n=1 Tax=Mycobacterium heckeshornense TaxID=110505 RepID=UPI0006622B06|nr:hypothetical protein [Mycobacterium heckeshornense]KMV23349.1 hypothetical protein ACT16_06680 [Mycobacterium heckeshornense]